MTTQAAVQSSAPVTEATATESTNNAAPSPKLAGDAKAKSGDAGGAPTVASVTGGKLGAAESAEKPAEKPETAQERKHKLKVNGKEIELSEAEVLRKAQVAHAADEKFKRAAEIERQAEQFLEALRTNPVAILTHPELGIDFRTIAEEYLGEHVRKEMMDPMERELEELRQFKQQQEIRQREEQENSLSERQRQEQEIAHRQTVEYYDKKISDVLMESNLPKTPYTVKRVADILKHYVSQGYDLDINAAVDMVREDYSTDLTSIVGSLDGDALISFLGEDIVKKIRRHDIAKLRAKMQGGSPSATPDQPSSPQQRQSYNRQSPPTTDKLKTADWFAAIRENAAKKGF